MMKTFIVLAFLVLKFAFLTASYPTAATLELEGFLPFNYTNHPRDISAADHDWDPRKGYYKCETTNGSGSVNNVQECANKLRAMSPHSWCRVLNSGGSRCTKMSVTGNAAVGICGPQFSGIKCPTAGYAVTAIAEYCDWQGLAGGTVWITEYPMVKIIVYRA